MRRRALLLSIVLLVVACTPGKRTIVWPAESWPVSSPEDQELDATVLDRIEQRLASGAYGYVDRFVLVRNGHLVMDQRYERNYERANAGQDPTSHPYNYYHTDWHPYYQGSDLHTLQSVTKGVTSLAIGAAMQRGELPDASGAVLGYFEDYVIQNLDERKRRITLEDLLTMRSGLAWDEWSYPYDDPRNTCTQLEASDDWIQFVLDRPMAHEPGEVFVYNSGASQLLSVVVKKATGRYVDEYTEEHLFRHLGITDYHWKRTPGGWPDTEGGLYLRAEDLARIGYLVLHDGVWEEKRLVPEDWVREMTTPHVEDAFPQDLTQNWGYGYQWWWIEDPSNGASGIHAALGYGGQHLFVVPELDLVAVFNAWNIYQAGSFSTVDLFLQQILPAVESR